MYTLNFLAMATTLPNQDSRSPHPKSQYATTSRAHVTVDLTAGINNNITNMLDKICVIIIFITG